MHAEHDENAVALCHLSAQDRDGLLRGECVMEGHVVYLIASSAVPADRTGRFRHSSG